MLSEWFTLQEIIDHKVNQETKTSISNAKLLFEEQMWTENK